MLTLLVLLNVLFYINQTVFAAVEPRIRGELWPGDPPEAKFWMGVLSTSFLAIYAALGLLFGWLADRTSRWALVGGGVIVWSLGGGACGWDWGTHLQAGFWTLLVARAFVGVGQAAFAPAAPALIADYYPPGERVRKISLFYTAIPLGGALGYILGDVADRWLGWRWAFYLVVPPGLLLGALCFLVRDGVGVRATATIRAASRRVGWRDYVGLFRNRSFRIDTLAMIMATFAISALAYWGPAYLEERQASGFGSVPATSVFGLLTLAVGLTATLAGGVIAARLRRRCPGADFLVSGASMLMAVPTVMLMLWTPFPWAWAWLALTLFFLFVQTGPSAAVLLDVTAPEIRATALAINGSLIYLLGGAVSAPLIGYLGGSELSDGLAYLGLVIGTGGALWIIGARSLPGDLERATAEDGEGD